MMEMQNKSPLSSEQLQQIEQILQDMGEFHPNTIQSEIDWFINKLGLHPHYFEIMPLPLIAQHIASLKASRVLNRSRGTETIDIQLMQELPDRAMYVILDKHETAVKIEHRIESKFSTTARIQSFRTSGQTEGQHVRLYFVQPPNWVTPKADPEETDIHKIADRSFLEGNQQETLERYQKVLLEDQKIIGPYIYFTEKPDTGEIRIMASVPTNSAPTYFSAISDTINAYNLHSNRKYREPFANGTTIFTIYLDHVGDARTIENIHEDLSLLYTIPKTNISELFLNAQLSAQAATYAFAASTFALQFITGYSDEYQAIAGALREKPELTGILQSLRTKLVKNSFNRDRIELAISRDTRLMQSIYDHFASIHFIRKSSDSMDEKTLAISTETLRQRIRKDVANENDRKIFNCFLDFNLLIQRTNFYKSNKVSLAFCLKPDFLDASDYPEMPYRIYFLVSAEFRGFHVRFRDVARGGIRMVFSQNAEVYRTNTETAFDENYNLALTQQRKNKDIPEGGAKGVILLNQASQDRAKLAFGKYIHGLLDLMMPNAEIRDFLNTQELLFLGPDEGTADLMDTAAKIARSRNYLFWKSFTTGKSLDFGGIPHDLYGMTTRGVHEYVMLSLKKLGLVEEAVTKIQTSLGKNTQDPRKRSFSFRRY